MAKIYEFPKSRKKLSENTIDKMKWVANAYADMLIDVYDELFEDNCSKEEFDGFLEQVDDLISEAILNKMGLSL